MKMGGHPNHCREQPEGENDSAQEQRLPRRKPLDDVHTGLLAPFYAPFCKLDPLASLTALIPVMSAHTQAPTTKGKPRRTNISGSPTATITNCKMPSRVFPAMSDPTPGSGRLTNR